jgi:smad nuclear-interacting protein 1
MEPTLSKDDSAIHGLNKKTEQRRRRRREEEEEEEEERVIKRETSNDLDDVRDKKKKNALRFGVDEKGNELEDLVDANDLPRLPKEKATFELSDLLRQESNMNQKGKSIDYDEPGDKIVPNERLKLRLYVFKGDDECEKPLRLRAMSRFVFGRDRDACDVPTDHPSCSKQHAVIQFRNKRTMDVYGEMKDDVAGYVMDLGSTNKTKLNGKVLEARKYYRLKGQDCLQFGTSTREYVVIDESVVR